MRSSFANTASAVRRPTAVEFADDSVVHVVSKAISCTGTLITEYLVLTAHHCVAARDAEGETVERNLDPSALTVQIGGDQLPWAVVGVKALVAPPCGFRMGHGDIALLVLSRAVYGVRTMVPRINRSVRVGEWIDPVGFGRCSPLTDGIRRVQREGGPIEQLGRGSILATASVCPGDSGGPAWDPKTGEVVAVISASVMDDNDTTRDVSTFIRLDTWRSLFENAQLIVDGASPSEVPPVTGCEADDRR